MFPTLQTGNVQWKDYDVSVRLRRVSTKGKAGLAFCMNDSIDTLVFSLEGKTEARLSYRHKEDIIVLQSVPYVSECDHFHQIQVSCKETHVECYLDGEKVLEAETPLASRGGKIGITADCPTQFTAVKVTVDKETAAKIKADMEARKAEERSLQAKYPSMKLYKKLDL